MYQRLFSSNRMKPEDYSDTTIDFFGGKKFFTANDDIIPEWLAERRDFKLCFPRFCKSVLDLTQLSTDFSKEIVLSRAMRNNDELNGLDEAGLRTLMKHSHIRLYPKGYKLFQRGETASLVYLLMSGQVTILAGGLKVDSVSPGMLFGELALESGDRTRKAEAVVTKSSRVVEMDALVYREVMHQTRERMLKRIYYWIIGSKIDIASTKGWGTGLRWPRGNTDESEDDDERSRILRKHREKERKKMMEKYPMQDTRRVDECCYDGRWEERKRTFKSDVELVRLVEGDTFGHEVKVLISEEGDMPIKNGDRLSSEDREEIIRNFRPSNRLCSAVAAEEGAEVVVILSDVCFSCIPLGVLNRAASSWLEETRRCIEEQKKTIQKNLRAAKISYHDVEKSKGPKYSKRSTEGLGLGRWDPRFWQPSVEELYELMKLKEHAHSVAYSKRLGGQSILPALIGIDSIRTESDEHLPKLEDEDDTVVPTRDRRERHAAIENSQKEAPDPRDAELGVSVSSMKAKLRHTRRSFSGILSRKSTLILDDDAEVADEDGPFMADSPPTESRPLPEISLPLYVIAVSFTASALVFGVNVGISRILYMSEAHAAKVGVWNFPNCICLDLTVTTIVFSILTWTCISAFVEMNLRTKWPITVHRVSLPPLVSSYLPAVLRHSPVLEVREKGRTCFSRMSFDGIMHTFARGSWMAMVSWSFLAMPTCSFITAFDGGIHKEGLGYSSWTLTWIRTIFIAIQTLLLSQICSLTTYIFHIHTTEDVPYIRSRFPSFISTGSNSEVGTSNVNTTTSEATTGLPNASPRLLEGIPEEGVGSDDGSDANGPKEP
ncbi:hypothetical protein FOL47_010068 [Perkinsus chesapeaki]|uniref:Cyclic nucleotide-binding domain-containing protein n=1 Tax=Perkinsus chesapeaki TaxID=330153 RepID=A0A7J6MQD7_PERCH|nr:hypothetical protein FOL47_010068 [Perkinsus chesapeaki]